MNNYIVFIVLLFFFSSCKDTVEIQSRLSWSIVNNTEHTLFFVVESTEGVDSTYVYPNDSAVLFFAKSRTIDKSILGYDTRGIGWKGETLFDLTDTTIFSPNSVYGNDLSTIDSLYKSLITVLIEENPDVNEFRLMEYSRVFKQIMSKDYTMLEKFPEYYE